MRQKLITSVVAAIAVAVNLNAQEQTKDSLLYRDFKFITNTDPWLASYNVAGLSRFQHKNISIATLSLDNGQQGRLEQNLYQRFSSGEELGTVNRQLSINISSIYRLNSKIVVSGMVGYDNFTGKDMSGSAFFPTNRLPFDIVEDSLTHAGDKHRDTYRLMGAISWDIYRGIAIGGKFDFTAANMAKYRDLRHKTKLMDITATAGLYIPFNPIALGVNYSYRRNTQSLIFSTYAENNQEFSSFINYGPWIGKIEPFSDNGFTNSSREQPLVDEYHGLGMEASWKISPKLSWFNELGMEYRKGYFGRKSPYTAVLTEHHSHKYYYHGRLSLDLSHALHMIDVNFDSERLVNDMNTYRSNRNEQGAIFIEYLDPTKSADKAWNNWQVGYTGYYDIKGELPTWTIQVGVKGRKRKQTGYDYPYLRRQNLKREEGYINLTYNIGWKHGVLAVDLGTTYSKGRGDVNEDVTFITPSDKQMGFPTMEPLMYRDYISFTAPQYNINGGLKYAFVFPHTNMKTYVGLYANYRHINGEQDYMLGKAWTTAMIKIGCEF